MYLDGVGAVSALPGDFNGDGSVDAADYVVWRKNDGTQQGYDLWRANFGQTAGGGAAVTSDASGGAIPEPSSLALLLLAAVAVRGVPRWSRSGQKSLLKLAARYATLDAALVRSIFDN